MAVAGAGVGVAGSGDGSENMNLLGARASRPPFLAKSCLNAGGTPALPGNYRVATGPPLNVVCTFACSVGAAWVSSG